MTAPRSAAARRELILYATPTGPLAEACDAYFAAIGPGTGVEPTTAQTYPPHCTLTGFFHRTTERADEVAAEVGAAVAAAGPVPADAVELTGLVTEPAWIGLRLVSPWLEALAASVAADHRLDPGDDPLRLKHGLHLSLAYGMVDDLSEHGRLAERLVDPGAAAGWEVALWERSIDGSWARRSVRA